MDIRLFFRTALLLQVICLLFENVWAADRKIFGGRRRTKRNFRTCGQVRKKQQENSARKRLGDLEIIGGKGAKLGDWPWQVLIITEFEPVVDDLKNKEYLLCGGSLINVRWVLSAAHCALKEPEVDKYQVSDMNVHLGFIDLQKLKSSQQRKVSKRYLHPKYSHSKLTYDFLLLKLKKPAVLSNNVDVVCLPQPRILRFRPIRKGRTGVISGWGLTRHNKTALRQPSILQAANVPFVDRDVCNRKFIQLNKSKRGNYIKKDLTVCAGYKDSRKGTCMGDSGGPLVFPEKSNGNEIRYFLRGVTSWGEENCMSYGVFGIVDNVMPWIRKTTGLSWFWTRRSL